MLKLLIPDMPKTADLLPYLEMIDESRQYVNFGPLNEALQARLSKHFDGAHVVTVANATLGLELALAALDLPIGSRILIPSFTFAATATAVVRAGHIPVFADVDPESWMLTPIIANRYAFDAVLPVCAFGAGQDLVGWDAFEMHAGTPAIVDAAAAFGNQKVDGEFPAVFSMHATKPLGAGEGGFIVVRDQEQAERLRRLTSFGLSHSEGLVQYEHSTNAKLSEYHAAVALASLDRFENAAASRRVTATAYMAALERHGVPFEVQQRAASDVLPTFQILLPRGVDVAAVRFALSCHHIETRRWYSPGLHRHPAFKKYADGPLPVTEDITSRLLGLPFHAYMNADDVDYICRALADAVEYYRGIA